MDAMAVREQSRLVWIRRQIEEQYRDHPTGCGGSFDELLCFELHGGGGGRDEHGQAIRGDGLTFNWLAAKWGISLPTLGELIYDHCRRLEGPNVNHDYRR